MSKATVAGAGVLANRNGGAPVGPARPELSLIEGAGIGIAVADDAANSEIDVTISVVGGGGTEWLNQFFPASNPDNYKGTYATMIMEDEVNTIIQQTFMIPSGIVTIVRADFVIIPDAGGQLYWASTTNFGQICANEDYQTHTDNTALAQLAVTQNEIECIDFSAALTGAVGGDIVGVEFRRDASNALDTINENVHFLGIIIQGSAA